MANISEQCVLIDAGFSMPKLTAVDKAATAAAVASAGAAKGSGHFTKKLYGAEDIKMATNLRDEVRSYHYRMTLPWMHNGPRILPSSLYMEYAARMRQYRGDWEQMVASFVSNYRDGLERSRARLVGMFDESNYPDPEDIRDKFDLRVNVLPVPSFGDFRVDIGTDQMAEIEGRLKIAEEAAVSKAMADVKDRLLNAVGTMARNLSGGAKVYDTLVTNVQDICNVLPAFNLTNDPKIEELRKEIESKLCTAHPDELRKDKEHAKQVGDEAQKIVDKMGIFFGA